ncbi:aldo/keto reductase [Sinirhodobacter populi]|uniref:Aldo/keto reductase n=1 Tax=Paenirhodobacter populi TaxID=2306993 RepID=A0A443KQ91_9RHOB|nr:aldo/keto reductase [Sinirhodobacter populi]RWR35145.1 aldo/keto reductase [Sinirhodobacter populi]
MIDNRIPDLTLNDGHTMPVLGFGTYKLNGAGGVEAMVSAIRNGYHLLDSAFNYENEGALGMAVRKSGVSRDELRITSKLPGRHQHFDEAIATVEESLYRAQLDYYDFYLIHWPNPRQGLYVEAWEALIEARKRGYVKSIGVCNFLPEHIDRLIEKTGVTPVLNQVELHPYFPQDEQRAYDKAHGIVTQSWSPLGRANAILQEPILLDIAARLRRSVGQVILRWHLQIGAAPVPKSSSAARQIENRSIFDFELTGDDMARIATLARPDGRTKGQDPATYEEF